MGKRISLFFIRLFIYILRIQGFLFEHVAIDKIQIKSCDLIIVSPAFSPSRIVTKRIQLRITIESQSIAKWFYLIPEEQQRSIFGKPLLRELKYQLDDDHEYILVNNQNIDTSPIATINLSSTSFFIIKKANLLEILKSRFSAVFASTPSLSVKHIIVVGVVLIALIACSFMLMSTAPVNLKGFDYKKPRAYFTSGGSKNRYPDLY
ncbi:hypothetical protein NCAS_0B03480 [Naumovozyma castellii]|uniref:Uncharacterized protein n=1 Tax=Naumovozyma castellii TaxID=27288 RepID=G0VBV6_NAUCA|nr:hypothetical protein NCAS_0B03480 [Naumovozyma castellii CBS 4309]CCC68432.1 hypothetical protein NCAS_0B03480 [Naumovozyma castellii CBS 4309]